MRDDGPDPNYVTLQMKHLEGLNFKPPTPQALAEVKHALLRARSSREVQDFVTDWLREQRAYPKVADIFEWLEQRRLNEQGIKPIGNPKCEECKGAGFVIGTVGQFEGAQPCACRAAKVTA